MQSPISEQAKLSQNLAACRRLLNAATTGLIALDKSGLIDDVNTRAVEMLGADPSYLLKKPISLFIAPEDQALFYINRSRIAAGTRPHPFEIRLRTHNAAVWLARISAQSVVLPDQHLPGMLLSIEDITAHRQALEALQFKEYTLDLLFSIIDDLAVWSTPDIDDIINDALEKVGLVTQADRVYVCLFHERQTRLAVTHEWLGDGIDSPALLSAPVDAFAGMLGRLKQRSTIGIADIEALAPAERAAHEGFHAPGARSVLFTPLFFGRSFLGIIGCDAVKQAVAWSRESQRLVKCVGGSIVNALLRRQAEKAPAEIRRTILQFVAPAPRTTGDELLEYEGPIEIMDSASPGALEAKAHWRFEAGEAADPDRTHTVPLKDGKTANIACRECNRQKLLDVADIRLIGTRLKATCVCGHAMYIKIELRREHRKTVNLDGVFIRGPVDRPALKSDDWGRIQIYDLSRHGIGFKVVGKPALRAGDRLRVKFTLNNTAGSVIQKAAVVRSVNEARIGCRFEGHDACDVTIGFYMLS